MYLADIRQAIAETDLAYRGAFHPDAADSPNGVDAGTLVLLGFAGHRGWPTFANSPEAADGQTNPLDRWSERVVTALAEELGATALFPFGGPPFLPFQRWAQKAEPVYPSPLGILIHPDWGLWHAYRGALAFPGQIALPEPDRRASPCDSCKDKPCLTTCPVAAFAVGVYNAPACIDHLVSPAGGDCMGGGCLARRACPIGAEHRYSGQEARFHMAAFRNSRP